MYIFTYVYISESPSESKVRVTFSSGQHYKPVLTINTYIVFYSIYYYYCHYIKLNLKLPQGK